MNDSGANQTTPIVHNGVIYLASPSNIVQALDGKTGDLIWETRVGPDQAPGYGGIRSIAIAEDKIFLPTSDAHMVALNARNGQDSLGHAGVRQTACVHQRRDRHRRQGADGSDRLRALTAKAATFPHSTSIPGSAPGGSTRFRAKGSPAARPGASCR